MLEIKVGEIAKRNLITTEEDSLVISAVKLMVDRNVGSVIVTREKRPIGIVTERDLLKKILATGRSTESTKVSEIMTLNPIVIEQDRPLGEAIDLMSRKKIRRLLVTKEGEIVGIFTQRDILNLNRLCLHCGKEIRSVLEWGQAAEPYTECQCGSRYHIKCANSVVHCVDCSRTLVANVVYPEPSETMSG
jgi:signal-transduction protein with cAMP-binding, CBS, and nucleotidyltransferase domain